MTRAGISWGTKNWRIWRGERRMGVILVVLMAVTACGLAVAWARQPRGRAGSFPGFLVGSPSRGGSGLWRNRGKIPMAVPHGMENGATAPAVAAEEEGDRGLFTVSKEEEIEWLAASFRPDGAFCQNPLRARVVPYFSNLAALALLPERADLVAKYIDWYLAHINQPDRWGVHGTIYDYIYRGDREISTGRYDSADSYASTFLGLVSEYYDVTGDRDFILQRLPKISLVARLLLDLQDESDGLIWALPNRWNKFLMDNCENYWGLTRYSELLGSLSMPEEAAKYKIAAANVRDGIQKRLWREDEQSYSWSLNLLGLSKGVNWSRWYPDAVAQIFPATFGVIDPGGDTARNLYEKLSSSHPGWQELKKPDPFPWALVAYTAARMGDSERSTRFVRAAEDAYLQTGRSYPWHSLESAYLLRTKEYIMAMSKEGQATASETASSSRPRQ